VNDRKEDEISNELKTTRIRMTNNIKDTYKT
jgi:hypothetical protein